MTRRSLLAAPALQTAKAHDFAIVGAGVFGTWIARALQARGKRVLLLDQHGPANNRASSGGESRIIRMGYGEKEIYTRWSLRALEVYQQTYAKLDPGLYHQTGFLWMARPGDPYCLANLKTFAKYGVKHERLDQRELAKRFPQIDFGENTWGIWEPEAGGLMARRGVQTVLRDCVARGLDYRQAKLVPAKGGPVLEGGERITAGAVIYACGPWLPRLFPELLGNKIRPTRQEVFYFGTAPGDPDFRPPRMPAWVDGGDTIYGLPDLEARGFKIAPDQHGVPVDPDTEQRIVPAASVDRVRAYLKRRFPKLAQAPCVQTEVCQYENTANGDYVLDKHPEWPDTWLAGGGSGHGYKHGPAVGEYLAGVLLDGSPAEAMFSLAAKPVIGTGDRMSTIPKPQ